MSRSNLPRLPLVLWRFKGTLLIQIVIITIGVLARGQSPAQHRQLVNQVGMSYELLTGTWFQSKPGIDLWMVLLVLAGTSVLEYLTGTIRMLLVVITGDWVATVLTAVTVRVWAGLGSVTAMRLLGRADSGTSALAHAGLGAAAVLLPPRWRTVALAALILVTLVQFVSEPPQAAIAHCWSALYGALVGWFVLRPGRAAGVARRA